MRRGPRTPAPTKFRYNIRPQRALLDSDDADCHSTCVCLKLSEHMAACRLSESGHVRRIEPDFDAFVRRLRILPARSKHITIGRWLNPVGYWDGGSWADVSRCDQGDRRRGGEQIISSGPSRGRAILEMSLLLRGTAADRRRDRGQRGTWSQTSDSGQIEGTVTRATPGPCRGLLRRRGSLVRSRGMARGQAGRGHFSACSWMPISRAWFGRLWPDFPIGGCRGAFHF